MNAVTILCGAMLGAGLLLRGRALALALLLALAPVLIFTLGGWTRLPGAAAQAPDDAPLIRLVQPNVPQTEKWAPEHLERNLGRLANLTQAPREDGAAPQLIVWPESATPYQVDRDSGFRGYLANLSPPGADLVLGSFRRAQSSPGQWHNSLFVLDPAGEVRAVYDKQHLVPFGEFVPLKSVLGRLGLSHIAWTNGFAAGPGPRTLEIGGGLKIAPLICYEAMFPQDMPSVENRPDLLLQITNGRLVRRQRRPASAFRPGALAHDRAGPADDARRQHRGVGGGRRVCRIVAHMPLGVMGYVDARLPAALPPTLYARYGEAGFLALLAALAGIAFSLWRFARVFGLTNTGSS